MKIAIVGGGSMGSAFAKALLGKGLVSARDLLVIEKLADQRQIINSELGCSVSPGPSEALSNYEIILLAVKPQDSAITLAALAPFIRPAQIIISILTGISLDALGQGLNGHQRIVRCMPNTPCQIGKGVSVYILGTDFDVASLRAIEAFLGVTGVCLRVDGERLIDAAGAISGSGPGYVFYIIEHFLESAEALGFSPEQARLLVAQTMRGSVELWQTSNLSPVTLRTMVTSKGGITEAAIKVFEKNKLGTTLIDGVKAAFRRCQELGVTPK